MERFLNVVELYDTKYTIETVEDERGDCYVSVDGLIGLYEKIRVLTEDATDWDEAFEKCGEVLEVLRK